MTQFDARNLSMVTDLYQMTMANGYFADGRQDDWATFDVFFRKNPDGAAFSVFAGLEQVLDFLEGMHFDERDVAYQRKCETRFKTATGALACCAVCGL